MSTTPETPEGWTFVQWLAVTTLIDRSSYDYRRDFIQYLRDNPAVWKAFARKARAAKKYKHRGRFGAKAILEVLRWESAVKEKDVTFKINNNFAPDLARLTMDAMPALKGYFTIRGSADRKDAPL